MAGRGLLHAADLLRFLRLLGHGHRARADVRLPVPREFPLARPYLALGPGWTGPIDEGFAVNYNDVDLCLRLWERGLRSVYCAEVELYHYESRNRARTVAADEQARFRARWAEAIPRDPYYSEWFEALRPRLRRNSSS